VLRTVNAQPTLWEVLLPGALLGLPAELEAVDRLLDDPVFFEPYRAHFHDRLGRPSIPIETYLRLIVPQVPLSAGLRAVVPGSGGLDLLAALRPRSLWGGGAAPDHADGDHHPVWPRRGRWSQRIPVGQGERSVNRPGFGDCSGSLRGWSCGLEASGSGGIPGEVREPGGADGARAPGRVPVAMEGDRVDLGGAEHQHETLRIWVRRAETGRPRSPLPRWWPPPPGFFGSPQMIDGGAR
jgi:hypothetical protein